MADPIIGKISVGDGATFTPAVSSAGVLSWSNNKNLANPTSVDIPQAVVDRFQLAPSANPTFTGTVTAEDITVSGTITGTASGNLPLTGGTLTGALTLADGGTALSNATVGTVVDDSTSSAVSIPQSSATSVVSINLDKGTWVITGHAYFSGSNVTADKLYSIGIGTTADSFGYGDDGSMTMHASFSGNLVLQTVRILQIGSNNTAVYLNSLCNVATSISVGRIRAIRIV